MNIEKKNFALSMAGLGISRLGTDIFAFAIGLFVLKLTGKGTSFAVTLALSFVPRIVLGPFVGNLVDRVNKKVIVVLSDLASGLVMLYLLWTSMVKGLTLGDIYIVTLLMSICSTFLENAFSASLPSLVSDEKITKINSARQTLIPIIAFVAPVLGGVVNGFVDINFFILANGVSFIISGISEMFIDFTFNEKEKNESNNSFFKDFKEGFKYLATKPSIYTIMFFALFINFFFSSVTVVVPFVVKNVLLLGDASLGIIMGTFPIGQVLGGIFVGSKNLKMSRKLLSGTIIALSFILLLLTGVLFWTGIPVVGTNIILIVFSILMGFTIMLVNIPLSVFFQTAVDREFLGRVGSLFGTTATAVIPLSLIIYGMLLDIIPAWSIVLITAVASLIISFLIGINKNLKEMGVKSEEKVA